MLYRYRARTSSGAVSSGTCDVDSEGAALAWIREQGMSPIAVEPQKGLQSEGISFMDRLNSIDLFPQKVTLKDKNVTFKQMATMVNAGITIAGTIELISGQTENRTLRNAMIGLRDAVSTGATMNAGMRRYYPAVFNNLEIALVKAGEEGGVLDISLARLADFVEAQYRLQRKVKSAMTYPSVIIFFTIVALTALATFIVPMFRQSFANIGMTELPAMTAAIFGFSDFLRAYFWAIPLPWIALFIIIKQLYKTPGGHYTLDKIKIHLPLVGDIIFKAIMTRAFRTFGTLVTAGVSILDAVEMSADVADNLVIKEAFEKIRERAQVGIPLSVTIREQKLFPVMVGHMIAVGEETGQIDDVLTKVADWYDMELDEKIKGLTSIIEPVLIVVIGGVVGLVVGSIFVPLIQAMQQFM